MRKKQPKKISVTFRCPPDILTAIDAVAEDNNADRTAVIEFALIKFFDGIIKLNKKKVRAKDRG